MFGSKMEGRYNVTRISTAVLPLMLLASTLAGFRPRWLVTLALTGATAIAVGPYLSMIPQRTSATTLRSTSPRSQRLRTGAGSGASRSSMSS